MRVEAAAVSEVRSFNRFITRHIGVLEEGLLKSPYSLTEARIIFELANADNLTATDLSDELGIDNGYLSRILSKLEEKELIEKVRSEKDGRHRFLRLTRQGQAEFALLDERSRREVTGILEGISIEDQRRLLGAMKTIEQTLKKPAAGIKQAFILRQHEPGDMGWVIFRNALAYWDEYGWDERYEALVAKICADFINNFDPKRERCWIAEINGERVGSVFLVRGDDEKTSKLRLLIVDPQARGLGLGSKMVEECIRFAKKSGYEKTTLWTNSVLLAARHIYEKAGFRIVKAEPHHSFGQDLIGETWELNLTE